MKPVTVLKKREAGPKLIGRDARSQGDAPSECEMISLRSFLEADNKRLWQAVLELSIETAALRRALKKKESSRRGADVKPAVRRLPRPCVIALAMPAQASEAEPRGLPSGR